MERSSSLTEYFDRTPSCSVSVHRDAIPTKQREETKTGPERFFLPTPRPCQSVSVSASTSVTGPNTSVRFGTA